MTRTTAKLWWLGALSALLACDSKKPAPEPSQVTAAAVSASAAASAAAPTETASALPPSGPPPTDTFETSKGALTVTPIQHGTVAFGFDEKVFLVDPTTSAPKGWLPKADVILVTHEHPDHFDPEAIASARTKDTLVVAPAVVADKLPDAKVLGNGESLDAKGVKVEAVPMYNEKRGPAPGKPFHQKGQGNGYLVHFADKTVYLSGDTECTSEMKALENVDIAFVCMNLPYTMPPAEAAECVKAFEPEVVFPYHYRDSDPEEFKQALSDARGIGVRVRDFYPKK